MTRAVKIVDAAAGNEARRRQPTADRRRPLRRRRLRRCASPRSTVRPARFDGLRPARSRFRRRAAVAGAGPRLGCGDRRRARRRRRDRLPHRQIRACRARSIAPRRCARLKQACRRRSPQAMRVLPGRQAVHRNDSKVTVEIGDVSGRALVLFNIAGDGTVQLLYPVATTRRSCATADLPPAGAGARTVRRGHWSWRSRRSSRCRSSSRRSSRSTSGVTRLQTLKVVERYRPVDGRFGTTGIFTAP